MRISKQLLIDELLSVKEILVRYLKNPVGEINNVPNWPWPKLLFFLAGYSGICGIITGAVEKRLGLIFYYFFTNPIVAFAMIAISTIFFGIFFKIFANRDLAWRHLFTVILFANLPHLLFSTAASYVPPIILIGLAFTCFILIKGFVDVFKLDRTLVIRVVAGLYIVFFLSWAISEITTSERFKKSMNDEERAPEVHLSK